MDFRFVPSDHVCCHAEMSKQGYDSTTRAVGYNRCVTGRRPRDENHVVRFGQRAENHSREGYAANQRVRSSLTSLQGGASVGTPWLPEEDIGRRNPLS